MHGVPTLVYRFEDLFDDDCRVSVVRGILQLAGLYDELRLNQTMMQSTRAFFPTRGLQSAINRYRNKQHESIETDVREVLKEPFVEEFGYSNLFYAWMNAKQSKRDRHSPAFLDPITKQGTRCFLYWGL